MAKQVKKWITINGNHVPVYEDGSLGGIATQFGQMRGSKTRTKDAVNKVMSDKGYQIEELEETDKRGRKLYKVTPPSTNFNKSPMKMTEKDIEEYASASLRADYRKSQEADLKEGEEYPIDVDRTKEKDRREKVKALEEAKAKEEGFASAEAMKAYEEEDRQSEKQAKSKSLADHSDIQKIADEHVKKIWNGGAANRELYDAADKWAEEHNFDKTKAKDAAFAAMNKKQMAEIAKREKAKGFSAKATKSAELARRQLDFNRPGEYAEIAADNWRKTAGVSNERMAEIMSSQDPDYDYEVGTEKTPGNIWTNGAPVTHHYMYRIPKEGSKKASAPEKSIKIGDKEVGVNKGKIPSIRDIVGSDGEYQIGKAYTKSNMMDIAEAAGIPRSKTSKMTVAELRKMMLAMWRKG